MDAVAARSQEWPVHTGVAGDLRVSDFLEQIGDGKGGREEHLLCRAVWAVTPARRRDHVEVVLAPVRARGERARWSLHVDYPVRYRRGEPQRTLPVRRRPGRDVGAD